MTQNFKQQPLNNSLLSGKRSFWAQGEAIATLVGTIIGAGVFTLPYVVEQASFLVSFGWFLLVLVFIIYLHLAFGEIVLRTSKEYRLPGYAGYYLGAPAQRLMFLTTFLTFSFSLLIYLLLASQFLQTLLISFLPSNLFPFEFVVILLWLILSLILLSRRDHLTKINFILSILLVVLFIVLGLVLLPHFEFSRVNWFPPLSKAAWLLPYGVFFYALNGLVAVPSAHRILKIKRLPRETFKKIIVSGILISAACYLLFILTVVGASGFETTPESILGLSKILGPGIIILGSGLGFLAVVTSYLIFADYIKKSFLNDFKWTPFLSNFLVILGPLILYFCHLGNILTLISFMGGMLGGFEGTMVLLILRKAKEKPDLTPAFEVPLNNFIFVFLLVALVAGALLQTFLVV